MFVHSVNLGLSFCSKDHYKGATLPLTRVQIQTGSGRTGASPYRNKKQMMATAFLRKCLICSLTLCCSLDETFTSPGGCQASEVEASRCDTDRDQAAQCSGTRQLGHSVYIAHFLWGDRKEYITGGLHSLHAKAPAGVCHATISM